MKPGTLFCLVTIKWIELVFLFITTGFVFAGTCQLVQRLGDDGGSLKGLVIATCIFVGLNLMYNNLFMNLRFKAKQDCYSCGLVIFDLPHYALCVPGFKWLC